MSLNISSFITIQWLVNSIHYLYVLGLLDRIEPEQPFFLGIHHCKYLFKIANNFSRLQIFLHDCKYFFTIANIFAIIWQLSYWRTVLKIWRTMVIRISQNLFEEVLFCPIENFRNLKMLRKDFHSGKHWKRLWATWWIWSAERQTLCLRIAFQMSLTGRASGDSLWKVEASAPECWP